MNQGLATSGEGIRSKRAIPTLAIIQGVAATGGMMIKGINALVNAKRASSCKAQPHRASLGYPFHNTAAHMEATPTREGI